MKKDKRTPAREALAAAIEVRDKAMAEKTEADAALVAFDKLFEETRMVRYHASVALDEAKAHLRRQLSQYGGNEAAVVREAAIQGLPSPRAALAAAQAVYDLEDERYRLGKEGREPVLMSVQAADNNFDWAARKVTEAVYAVEREPLAAILEEAKKAHSEAYRTRSVLQFAAGSLYGVNTGWNFCTDPFAADIRNFLTRGVGDNDAAAIAPWQAAREALMRDADAELPQ